MGRATVSDLDDLEWKPWPKTPHYFFVDLHEEVRLQWDTRCEAPTKYAIKTVSPEFPYSRDIIRHLTKRQVMFHLKQIDRYIPVLPLTRESIYEPTELLAVSLASPLRPDGRPHAVSRNDSTISPRRCPVKASPVDEVVNRMIRSLCGLFETHAELIDRVNKVAIIWFDNTDEPDDLLSG